MHATKGEELVGKVVVVTGGSRGIGREIVREALARGAQVASSTRPSTLLVAWTLSSTMPGSAANHF
jgi:NAD(P)-dependent dehydrogenase (short-subunit alcohol dehydrogenase family)